MKNGLKKMNPNENCLAGMRCPDCGSYSPFDIVCNAVFTVTDGGTDDCRDVDWESSSPCYCVVCDKAGVVGDFYENNRPHSP